MTKSTITRERLEWLSQISCRDDIEDIGGDEIRELASMALAAMDSEPVGWTDEQELRDVEKDGCGYLFKANPITPHADPRRVILLYRHAQLAPASPVCTCPSGDGSLRWPCPVHAGNSPVIPDSARDALEKALAAMEFMGDTLNNLDAVCTEDVELVAPAFDAVRSVLAAAPQEVK
ncbi:hypothetical protein ACOZ2K_000528 [Klebsiella pneumoniae]